MTFTPADIAFWQREVNHWAAVWQAAWEAHAYDECEAASIAIRALLDLRDVIQAEAREQGSDSEKLT